MPEITATTPTNLRKHLFDTLTNVTEEHTQVIITMKSGKNAVLISEDEMNRYRGYEETDYLLQNPSNRKQLFDSLDELDKGKGRKVSPSTFLKGLRTEED